MSDDVLSPAERALYDTAYFSRGESTELLVGLFYRAYHAHIAVMHLKLKLVPTAANNSQNDTRKALISVMLALLIKERNDLLDEFAKRWKAEALDG